jgi:hypothetical protein
MQKPDEGDLVKGSGGARKVRQYPNALLELAQRVWAPMDLGPLEGKS